MISLLSCNSVISKLLSKLSKLWILRTFHLRMIGLPPPDIDRSQLSFLSITSGCSPPITPAFLILYLSPPSTCLSNSLLQRLFGQENLNQNGVRRDLIMGEFLISRIFCNRWKRVPNEGLVVPPRPRSIWGRIMSFLMVLSQVQHVFVILGTISWKKIMLNDLTFDWGLLSMINTF